VEVGTSHNTARFAVDSIRRWWKIVGRKNYPNATRLLILADSGGSNGCRIWMWKKLLCELAAETGLKINARWNRREYKPKENVPKEEKARLNFKNHNVIPLWNYTVYPKQK